MVAISASMPLVSEPLSTCPMHPVIAQHRTDISAICQRYQIRRLEVFGSAARADNFDAKRSDADFFVAFTPETPAVLNRFFGIKSEL